MLTTNEAVINIQGLSKSFNKVKALQGVSLTIPRGSIFGLLGPNGAGKTTLIRILTTILLPNAGQAEVTGYDVVRQAQALRQVIGLAGQFAAVDENLTGRENLFLIGRLYHLSWQEARRRAEELLSQFELEEATERTVKTYSGGMRRRLDLAASLMGQPKVLFLDEPTTGLDPRSRLALWRMIEELAKAGTTIFLTTQYLEEADQLADQIAVINFGRIVASGSPKELKEQSGGDILELHLTDKRWTTKAADLLADLGSKPPQHEPEFGRIILPVQEGTAVLLKAVRRLDEAGIATEDIALHRPTLDDVFLALTKGDT